MIKIIEKVENKKQETVIQMRDMEPLQVGQVVEEGEYYEHYVIRTAGISTFEIMDLTAPDGGACWGRNVPLKVRLLRPDEIVTLEIRNEVSETE